MSTENRPPFTPLRRVITGHSTEGKSIVVEDAPVEPRPFGKQKETYFTDLYWTDEFPCENGVEFKDRVKEHPFDIFSQTGSSVRLTEFPPGGKGSPFHRTVTIDYAIIMHGSITLYLDDDKRVVLNAGDVIVQRGTIHKWVNEGTEWCRMLAIMLPAQTVNVGGTELGHEFRI